MKKIGIFIISVLSVIFILCLVACSTPKEEMQKKFAITLDYGNENINKTLSLSKGDNLDDYTNVIVDDKAVLGWVDKDGKDIDVSNIDSDITVYPKWGVCVRFFNEFGDIVAERIGTSGFNYPIPTYQAKAGTEFSAWLDSKSHQPLEMGIFPESNADYLVSYTYSVYQITYNANGGTISGSVKNEYTIQSSFNLPQAVKEGELFVGWFDDYNRNITKITSETVGDLNLTARYTKTSFQKELRSETASITDTGIEKQKFDSVDLTRYVNLETLKKYGYNKVEVTINMDVREEYDGYQHCYLYSDSYVGVDKSNKSLKGIIYKYMLGKQEQVDDPYFLASNVFEHGAGERNTNWERYQMTFLLDIDELLNSGTIYIRYSASGLLQGLGINTWQNKNISISFQAFQI